MIFLGGFQCCYRLGCEKLVQRCQQTDSNFSEVSECWVYLFKSLVDLFADLCAGENNFAADKDEQDNLWFDHTIDQAREEFRLV